MPSSMSSRSATSCSPNWQVAGHVGELRNAGDYITLDITGERGFVMRGDDGALRAFAMSAATGRQRWCTQATPAIAATPCAASITAGPTGLDGRLKAVPGRGGLSRTSDKGRFGLKPLEFEVRGGASCSCASPAAAPTRPSGSGPTSGELAAYRIAEMEPLGARWQCEIAVDWKNVMDNYLEGYHVPGRPSRPVPAVRQQLRGRGARGQRQPRGRRAARQGSANWSERAYQRLRLAPAHLDAELAGSWRYYALLPNNAFDVYPEFVDFFHIVPVAPGRARLRVPGLRPARRRPRHARRAPADLPHQRQGAARGRRPGRVRQAGLATSAYGSGYLSEKEACLRQLHDMVRTAIPVARRPEAPAPGTVAAANAALA